MDILNCDDYDLQLNQLCEDVERENNEDKQLYNVCENLSQHQYNISSQDGGGLKRQTTTSEIEECPPTKKKYGPSTSRYDETTPPQASDTNIRKVINGCLWQRYMDRKSDIELENNGEANERMLFHGTNYGFEVVNYGFDERYVALADRSFGAGIYFATSSSAANELAFGKPKTGCRRHNRPDCNMCKRNMILARVTLGKEYAQVGAKTYAHPPPGFDSVVGNLTDFIRYPYNDYIVYRGEQAYPEYLITYTIRTDIEYDFISTNNVQ